MSEENVKLMFEKIEKVEDMKKRFTEFMQSHQSGAKEPLPDKIVEFARTAGFIFSKEDLASTCAELSDEELEKVTGGVYNLGTINWGWLLNNKF